MSQRKENRTILKPAVMLECDPLSSSDSANRAAMQDYIELSLADYIKEHPKYKKSWMTQVLFSLAQLFHSNLFIRNYVITVDDYKGLVEQAKTTKFGLLILTLGQQKIIFTANPSIQDQLVKLETVADNQVTSRLLYTDTNRRLLENNPVSQNSLNHGVNYIEEQRAFFSNIAADKNFTRYIDNLFPGADPGRILLKGDDANRMIGERFTQFYFQALFSNKDTGFSDQTIAANVATHYEKICELYAEIELCTGKHGLTFGKFQSAPAENNTSNVTDDQKLIPLLYQILCYVYGVEPVIIDDNEATIASKIIELMRDKNARVLPVFDKLSNDTNKCFNLLSWLDNSLNIINTLTNYVAYIYDNVPQQDQDRLEESYVIALLPQMRALSTLFMRKVNSEAAIGLKFKGFDEVIFMDENSRIVMTNSMQGVVFGAQSRKCPSRDFSFKLIPRFILNFFQDYSVSFPENAQPTAQTNSWFWNILVPKGNRVDSLCESLDEYIAKVEKNRSSHGSFNYGFWHHGESRAVNRHGNYLLAKALKDMLLRTRSLDGIYGEYNGVTTSSETHSVKEALLIYRKHLMGKDNSLVANPYFNKAMDRGINSQELNNVFANFSLSLSLN